MKITYWLFDMDGVLLKSDGYHTALRTSVMRLAKGLGAPQTTLSEDQITKFETLSITNEWDTLAICAALILLEVWKCKPDVRINNFLNENCVLSESVDFDKFIRSFIDIGSLPGESAYGKIVKENPWLLPDQLRHLKQILYNCRDIYRSLTLPHHLETVLGSEIFRETYGLEPTLNTESFLLKYDRPLLTSHQTAALHHWLQQAGHKVGIMTNRQSKSLKGYLSPPEAELGVKLINLPDIPMLASGMLGWYAVTRCQCPPHIFQKPHPMHTLGLIQLCMGKSIINALDTALAVCRGEGNCEDWKDIENGNLVIFEDSVKGLHSAKAACALLAKLNIPIDLTLIGVTQNEIKRKALINIADKIITDLNSINWDDF